MDMKRVIAAHEAAHAVVYRSHEIQVVRVEVCSEPRRTRRGMIAGGCFARPTAASGVLCVYQGLAAGVAAERLLCGVFRDWDNRVADYRHAKPQLDRIYAVRGINTDMDAQEACELECWVSTLERVWSRYDQIIAVAKRLLETKVLSGDDVDLTMADHELRSDTMADEIRRVAVRITRPYRRVRC